MNSLILPCDTTNVSDGYHTFGELYDHRCVLFLALLTKINNGWYSKKHCDGSVLDGWFIAGVEIEEDKQITYHLPNKYLEIATEWLREEECAPEWDGHTSEDVLQRVTDWISKGSPSCPE